MCWATAIPYVMGALSAYGAYSSADAQKDQANYQAKVAANNAQTAEMQAQDAKARGDVAAAGMRRKYAALLGTQRASLAARGLDISDGSPNAILQDTAYFGAVDEQTTRENAAREAWGYRVRRDNFQSDADAHRATAGAFNPLLSAAMAGVGTYFHYDKMLDKGPPTPEEGAGEGDSASAGGYSGAGTLFSSAYSVAPKWYRG